MPGESPNSTTQATGTQRFAWAITLLTLPLYTYWQLKRVELGKLFALSLPWDRAPSSVEVLDARLTAQTYLFPAIVAVIAMVCVAAFLIPRVSLSQLKLTRAGIIAVCLFLLSVLADLFTTLLFFHQEGIQDELHPGIRLFGYAYGLTIGPLAGKVLQAVGILMMSLVAGRYGLVLLIAVTILYFLAAAHNAMQFLAA